MEKYRGFQSDVRADQCFLPSVPIQPFEYVVSKGSRTLMLNWANAPLCNYALCKLRAVAISCRVISLRRRGNSFCRKLR